MQYKSTALQRAKKIKLIIADVDGVLTDGSINIAPEGEDFKPFCCKDGLGVTIGLRHGLDFAIITGRKSKNVQFRAQENHIAHLYMGQSDKREAFADLKNKLKLTDDEISYIGDDLIDLPIMYQVGLPVAVADAVDEVRNMAQLVTKTPGGHGALRELIEFILKSQGKWDEVLAFYRPDSVKLEHQAQ